MKKLKNPYLIAFALLISSCLNITISKKVKEKFEKYKNNYSCIMQHCFDQTCVEKNKQKCANDPAYPEKEEKITCYDLQCNDSYVSLKSYIFDACVDWCATSPDAPGVPGSLYVAPQPQ